MTTKSFCSYVLLPLAFVLLSNCKKRNKKDALPLPEPPPIPEETKRYLPIKFESGNNIITIKYLNNTPLIAEIESTGGKKDVYSYNNDHKPVKYERYQNNEQVYLIDYLRNADGLVIKVNRFIIAPMTYIPDGYNTLSYDTKNMLINFKTYNNANKLLNEEVNEYNSIEDLVKKTTKVAGQSDATTNLTYDNKNGIFKEVLFTELLKKSTTNDILISASHNIVDRIDNVGTTHFNYQYNTDDYPVQYILTNGNDVKTVKITYRQL